MLYVSRVQTLAEGYTPQEMMAAMVWQRRFKNFERPEVIADLVKYADLWKSFVFMKPVYAPDKDGPGCSEVNSWSEVRRTARGRIGFGCNVMWAIA